jgi:DNA adenine methylase
MRQGSKLRIAKDIIQHFPKHTTYIEMFFGAGGLFFKKPKAKFNICNDIDSDVFNLWKVLQDEKTKDEFYEYMKNVIHHEDILEYWQQNKETEPVKQASRFIFLSNFTFHSGGSTLVNLNFKPKDVIIRKVEQTYDFIKDVSFINKDFREVLKSIDDVLFTQEQGAFLYADPPYLNTRSVVYGGDWKQKDTEDLFEILVNSGNRFAISEFNNEVIDELVDKYDLHITDIGERKNISKRQNEVLITNYDVKKIKNKLF